MTMWAMLTFVCGTVMLITHVCAEGDGVILGLWQRQLNTNADHPIAGVSVASGIAVLLNADDAGVLVVQGRNVTNGSPLWQMYPVGCELEGSMLITIPHEDTFVVACNNSAFVSIAPTTGVIVHSVHLRANYSLSRMGYNANDFGFYGNSFMVPDNSQWVVLSVEFDNGTAGSITYGSVLLDVGPSFSILYGNSPQEGVREDGAEPSFVMPCDGKGNIVSAVYNVGSQLFQVCSSKQVLLYTLPSTSEWTMVLQSPSAVVFDNMSAPVSASFASGASFGVTLSWQMGVFTPAGNWWIAYTATVFSDASYWLNASRSPYYDGEPSLITATVGEVLVVVTDHYVAWNTTTGTVLWESTVIDFPIHISSVPDMFPGLLFVLESNTLLTWNASSGEAVANVSVPYSDPEVTAAYMFGAPVCAPMPSPLNDTYLCNTILSLVVFTPSALLFIEPQAGQMLATCAQDYTGIMQPTVVAPTTSLQGGGELLIPLQGFVRMLSLSLLWSHSELTSLSFQGAVSFVGTERGAIVAIDRGGNEQWSTVVASTGATLKYSAALGNDILLTILNDGFTIAAYSVYNGSLLGTLQVPSDCNATSIGEPVTPQISANFVLGRNQTTAYFTAGFACLFRVDIDLSIHAIAAPWPLTMAPTLDEDNGLAYFLIADQLFALDISAAAAGNENSAAFLLYTFSGVPYDLSLTPSSSLSSQANLGKHVNPLLYVVTVNEVIAIDVLAKAAAGPAPAVVWKLDSSAAILSSAWYNNSLYTLSDQGICRIALDADLPPGATRQIWCHGRYAVSVANDVSNIAFARDGTLLFLLDTNLYAIDAFSANARWSLSGYVTVDVYSEGSCVLSCLDDVAIVLIVCPTTLDGDVTIYPVDALLSSHEVLFFIPQTSALTLPTGDATFAQSTILIPYVTPSSGVQQILGIIVPDWIKRRNGGAAFPSPAPTAFPSPNTVAPGFHPTPVPTSNQSYNYPSGVQVMAPIRPSRSEHPYLVAPVSSAILPTSLFPSGAMVLGPMVVSGSSVCYFTAETVHVPYDDGNVTLWTTTGMEEELPASQCSQGAAIRVLPTLASSAAPHVPSYVVVVLLGASNILFGLDAASGVMLWNASATLTLRPGEQFSLLPPQAAPSNTVIVLTTLRVLAIDVLTGVVRSSLDQVGIGEGQLPIPNIQIRIPPHQSAAVTTSRGVAVIVAVSVLPTVQILAFNGTSANVTFAINTSSTSSVCAQGGTVLLAMPPNHNETIVAIGSTTNYIYGGCIDAATNSNMLLFRVHGTTGAFTLISNQTMTGGDAGLNALMVDEITSPLSPMLYAMTNDATHIVTVSTGATVVSDYALTSPARLLLSGNHLVLFSTTGAMYSIDKSTGAFQWHQSLPSSVVFPPAGDVEQIAAVTILDDLMVIAVDGAAYGVNATTGVLLYTDPSLQPSVISGVVVWAPSTLLVSADAGQPLITLVYPVLKAYVPFHALSFMPSTTVLPISSIDGSSSSCFTQSAYDVSIQDNGLQPIVVSTADSLLTNFNWTVPVGDVQIIRVVRVPSLSANAIVIATSSTISIMREDTAQVLATYDLITECPAGGLSRTFWCEVLRPSSTVDGAEEVLLWDTYCMYRFSTATFLSTPLTVLDIGSSAAFRFDTATVAVSANIVILSTASSGGMIAAVDVSMLPSPQLSLLWVSDVMDVLNCQGTAIFPLFYNERVTRSAQQLIVTCGSAMAALSIDSGLLVWYELYDDALLPRYMLSADAHMVVFTTANISKVRLDVMVGNTSRVVWSVPCKEQVTWSYVSLVPNTNLGVALGQAPPNFPLYAVNLTTGEILWHVKLASEVADGASAPSFATVGDVPPTVVYIANNQQITLALNVLNGKPLFAISAWIAGMVGSMGVESAGYSSMCFVRLPRTNVTVPAMPAGVYPFPTVPPGYSISLPPPTVTQAPNLSDGSPFPLLSWTYEAGNQEYSDYAVFSTVNSRKAALILSTNGSTYSTRRASIIAVDAVTGVALGRASVWTHACDGRWFGKLNEHYSILACHKTVPYGTVANFSFAVIDTSSTNTLGSIVVDIPIALELSTLPSDQFVSMPINSTMTCVVFGLNGNDGPTGVFCISLASLELDGRVTTSTLQCPGGGSLTTMPVYSTASETFWLPCSIPTQEFYFGLFEMSLVTQTVLWNTTWDYYYNIGVSALTLSSDGMYLGCVVANQYYNWTVLVINVLDGSTTLNASAPCYGNGPTFLLGIQESMQPNASTFQVRSPATNYIVVVGAASDVIAFETSSGDVLWTTAIDNQFSSAAAVLTPATSTMNLVLVVAVGEVYNLVALDIHSGEEVLTIASVVPQNYNDAPIDVFLIRNGTSLLCSDGDYVFVFDIVHATTSVTISDQLLPFGFYEAEVAGGSHVIDFVFDSGTIEQVVIPDSASVTPRVVDRFEVVSESTTVASSGVGDFVVASNGKSTYFINSSGFQLWGTKVDIPHQDELFAPMLFRFAGQVGSLLIKSATPRIILAFDASTGYLKYAATLPLCGLSTGDGTTLSAAGDAQSGKVFVVTGTRCLFTLDVVTGSVVVQTFETPLLPAVVASDQCVVTISVFGDVQCNSLQNPALVLWSVHFGYVPPSADKSIPIITMASGLLFATLRERIVALSPRTGVVAWEYRIQSTAHTAIFNNVLYVASCLQFSAIPLDPSSNPFGATLWSVNSSELLIPMGGAACSSVTGPRLSSTGSLIVSINNVLAALDATNGNVLFTTRSSSSTPCNMLFTPPVLPTGHPLNNVFFTTCERTEARSIKTGALVAILGAAVAAQQHCSSPIQMLQGTNNLVFCTDGGAMSIEAIPDFIASLAPAVQTQPTVVPAVYTLPPNAVPHGLPTPAPTFPQLPQGVVPNAACVWAMQSMYGALASCLTVGLQQAFSVRVSTINCSQAATSLEPCTRPWLDGTNEETQLCPGAAVYMNTALGALNHTGAMGVCGRPDLCIDGPIGASSLCGVVNSAMNQADGVIFPSEFLSRLPPPLNSLPTFQADSPSPETRPNVTLSAGAVAGIVIGVLCVTAVASVIFRRNYQKRAAEGLLANSQDNLQDGPIQVSSRTGSELGSVSGSARRLFSSNREEEARYASIN